MGGGGQNTVVEKQQSLTPEETERNKIYLNQLRETAPTQTALQLQGMNLTKQILTPDYVNKLAAGISPEAIGNQAATLAKRYGAGFQGSGIADSGVAFRETSRGIANELLYPTEQFNKGSLQSLLNLALSGYTQVQQPNFSAGGGMSNTTSSGGINRMGSSISGAASGALGGYMIGSAIPMATAVGGAAAGAKGGATAGSTWGPWGAVIGAGVGGLGGYFSSR